MPHSKSKTDDVHRCGFPGCTRAETKRSALDSHHIKPVCMGGNNLPGNRVLLCPDHHRKVFVPGCPSGHHAVRHMDSIVLVGYLQSSEGRVLHYFDPSGKERYWCYRLSSHMWDG